MKTGPVGRARNGPGFPEAAVLSAFGCPFFGQHTLRRTVFTEHARRDTGGGGSFKFSLSPNRKTSPMDRNLNNHTLCKNAHFSLAVNQQSSRTRKETLFYRTRRYRSLSFSHCTHGPSLPLSNLGRILEATGQLLHTVKCSLGITRHNDAHTLARLWVDFLFLLPVGRNEALHDAPTTWSCLPDSL